MHTCAHKHSWLCNDFDLVNQKPESSSPDEPSVDGQGRSERTKPQPWGTEKEDGGKAVRVKIGRKRSF